MERVERLPFIAAVIKDGKFVITLREDYGDFWVNLGPCWGRFTNPSRDPECNTNEENFLLVEVRLAGCEPPSPVIASSNVLWRKQEALEVLLKKLSYLEGLRLHEEQYFQEEKQLHRENEL